jgi:inhibitor of cysteine peptidase
MVSRSLVWVRSGRLVLLVSTLALVSLLALVSMAGCNSDTPASTASITSTGSTAAEDAVPGSLQLTEADDGGSFEVQAGGTVDISLEANPSTGYFWELNDPDPEASLLEQVSEPTFVPDNPSAVGSAGILTFVFRAADKGEMAIDLVYLPPSGDQTPTKTFHIILIVR